MNQGPNNNVDYNNYGQWYSEQCILPPSTSTLPPSSCVQVSQNTNHVQSSLNNYGGNNYCGPQVPSTNFMQNRYSNAQVQSHVNYPQHGYSSSSIKIYNNYTHNQMCPARRYSTEGCYIHVPVYSQSVIHESQNYSPNMESISNQNQQISDNNYPSTSEEMDGREIGTKRTRQIYSKEQTKILEDAFNTNVYVTRERRAQLSKQLSLSEKKIKVWFQNRRTKIKKQLTQQ